MKEEFENIDKLFKRQLRDFSPDVPEGAWENIAMNLANSNKSKKVPLFFWKVAAGIALLIGSTVLGTYLLTHEPNSNQITKNNLTETNQQITNQNTSQGLNSINYEDESQSESNTGSHSNDKKSTATNNKLIKSKSNANNNNFIAAQKQKSISLPEKRNVVLNNYNETKETGLKKESPSATHSENIDLLAQNNETKTPNKIQNQLDENQNVIEEKNNSEIVKEEKIGVIQNQVWNEIDGATNETNKKEKLWSIGGQAGPQYTYRSISSEINAPELLDMSNRDESGTVAYAAGVHIEYKPARRLSVQTGVYYSKYSTQGPVNINVQVNNFDPENPSAAIDRVNTDELIIRFPNASVDIGEVNTTNITQATDKSYSTPNANLADIESINVEDVPNNTTSTRNYEYIEIPIIARFAVVDRKVNVNILGGISTNVLINNNIEVDFPVDLPSDYETKNINSLNYSSTVGFGIGYDITSNISFSLEPQFKYFLSSQSYSRNDVRPYSLGIYSGVKYLF